MLLLILVIGGVAIFCFAQGYIVIGVVCLTGFSKHIAFPALIATSVYLFAKGHWVTGILPLLLIAWNIIGVRWLTKGKLRDVLIARSDSAAGTCISIYTKAKTKCPGKSNRDYLKIVLLTKPPFDYQHDKVIDYILDTFPDIESMSAYVAEHGKDSHLWDSRRRNLKFFKKERKERNAEFFHYFWS